MIIVDIKVVKDLVSITLGGNDSEEIIIVPIRFETDPITGFFVKCPICQKVTDWQLSEINDRVITCGGNCKLMVDVDEIKSKIVS